MRLLQVLEIQSKNSASGISLGGAGALLGLAGIGGGGGDSTKDIAMLTSYKVNSLVILN